MPLFFVQIKEIKMFEINTSNSQGFITQWWWQIQTNWIDEFEQRVAKVMMLKKKEEERKQFFLHLGRLNCVPKLVHCPKTNRSVLVVPLVNLLKVGLLNRQGKLPAKYVIKKTYLRGIEEKEVVVPYIRLSYVKRLVSASNGRPKSLVA
jgi:hypothetical protein